MKLSPNVKWLLMERASQLMVERSKPYPTGPHGSACGVAARLAEGNGKNLLGDLREANTWVEQAISVVRVAAEPNPFKNSTDEEIATEIRSQIEKRKIKLKANA